MPDFVVHVEDWPLDEEHSVYPEGSRDKELLRCPQPRPKAELIAGHRYLFKQSRDIYPEQFWAEVIAYRIGLLTRVAVPVAFPAWNRATGTCGALIEWFYGYSEIPAERYVRGSYFLHSVIDDYDLKKGKQHNLHTVQRICAKMARSAQPPRLAQNWLNTWARVLAFDALIGNTDRHHDNWGFLFEIGSLGVAESIRLAPAFDNGTSLATELTAERIATADDVFVTRYIARGTHHMRWSLEEPKKAGHRELLQRMVAEHPQLRVEMVDVLTFDENALRMALMNLPELEIPVPLSRERAAFMLRLTLARRDHLLTGLSP